MATSTGQLLFDGGRLTASLNVSMTRGDTKELHIDHDLYAEAIAEARLIVRTPSAGDDGPVWLELTLSDHPDQWDLDTATRCTVLLRPENTRDVPVGTYQIAVEFVDVAGRVYTPAKGNLGLEWDGVHDTPDVVYAGYATLEDINGQIAALLAVHDATRVTIAAEAGDGVLTVEDAALFEAADDLWVQTSGAAYEAHEVDSIDGNEITLVGTLTADVAVGNVVQLGVGA